MDILLLKLIDNAPFGPIVYVVVTSLISALLSFFVGLERQLHGEAAGVRTHTVLAAGSSLLMTLSIWAIRIAANADDFGPINYDAARIAAAVVAGIGFLGGGVIVHEKFSVKGLATASTLWFCSAIGLACGAGFVLEACGFTAATLIVLFFFGKVSDMIYARTPSVQVIAKPDTEIAKAVRNICEENGLPLRNIRFLKSGKEELCIDANFTFHTDFATLEYFAGRIAKEEGVLSAEVVHKKNKKKTSTPES